MKRGNFFTFSGMEGTGKSTITYRLAESDIGSVRIVDPHPYYREMLCSDKYDPDEYTEMLTFCASRSYNYNKFVIPAITDNKNVYADRWSAETFVYQGLVKGNSIKLIEELNSIMIYDSIVPDIEFILLANPETSIARSIEYNKTHNIDENRFEKYGIDFHTKIFKGFKYYHENCDRSIIINTEDKTIDNVYDMINELTNILKK